MGRDPLDLPDVYMLEKCFTEKLLFMASCPKQHLGRRKVCYLAKTRGGRSKLQTEEEERRGETCPPLKTSSVEEIH